MDDAARLRAGAVRRRELAAFLRSRRERITPDQVGLAVVGSRRTPGLRREEVAQLAGVGVTWYTWLEQGRDIRASEQVLLAVAGALRLSGYEREHLFLLARDTGSRPDPSHRDDEPGTVRTIVDSLDPCPAVVHNSRTDILAYNRAYNWLMDIDDVPPERRNALLQCATNPLWRDRLQDWPDRMRRAVAEFRATMTDHLDDPAWVALVEVLRRESPTFDRLWDEHEVRPMHGNRKSFRHPVGGDLDFEFTHFWCGRGQEYRLTVYTPAEDTTADLMTRFAGAHRG